MVEIFYSLIGGIFLLVAIKALRNRDSHRYWTGVFWTILAAIFIAGPYFPGWVYGGGILLLALISGSKKVRATKNDAPSEEEIRDNARTIGGKVFIPVLSLAVTAFLAATFLPFGASNAIGISALVGIGIALFVTKAPIKRIFREGARLMDTVGSASIFPQLLAALGALFTVAGVGKVIAGLAAQIIPPDNPFIAVVVFCLGMFFFAFIMGNGFAAFSVIMVGIAAPFLFPQGANPTIIGAVGITAGYCGALCTPMAANFNIVPAVLLETKDRYIVIKSQLGLMLILLAIHILFINFFAY
jgi:uncharacterized membrane protein